jgi:hypothetical protein
MKNFMTFFFAVFVSSGIAVAQPDPLTYPLRDCTNCDSWNPFVMLSCQWVITGTPVTGKYYELESTRWTNDCHPGGEAPLPYAKSTSFTTPTTEPKYSLIPDSVSAEICLSIFGLSATWETTTQENTLTDTYYGSCDSRGCCLPVVYALREYDYKEYFYKRQVWTGTLDDGHWSDCAAAMRQPILKTFCGPVMSLANKSGYVPSSD